MLPLTHRAPPFCSRPCCSDQEKPRVMFTACQLHYLHIPNPLPPLLRAKEDELSSMMTELHLAAHRARVAPRQLSQQGRRSPLCAPLGSYVPLPQELAHPSSWHTPTVRSKGERCHFAPFIPASCQQCQLTEVSNWIYVTGSAALWLEGSIIKLCQACLIFQYHLQ